MTMRFHFKNSAFIALLSLFTLLPFNLSGQSADFQVVPLPKVLTPTSGGNFQLDKNTLISYSKEDKATRRNAEYLAQYIEKLTGMKLTVTNLPAQKNCIRLTTSYHHTQSEAYRIRSNSEIIWLDGASPAGLFYAVQTFRKALPVGITQSMTIPSVEIKDYPRFSYRGAHLDVARHFISTDSIYRFIDMLALHHINRFHWHLTDDQGWRIEIKKYPRLTSIGSKRPQTVIGGNTDRYDGIPHEGFYTQKEIKAIIKYAADRFITIIPEIDLPGHMQAALAAYPDLGCTGGPYEVWQRWGVSDHVLCAGKEETFEFIGNVLDEIVKIFPSEYIHIGGDECPKTQWKQCSKCQQRIRQEHLEADGKHSAEERLQSYVIRRAEQHLNRLGRKIIGWDETLEGGLAPNATVMSWRGEAGGIEAARQKHPVIMTPNTYLYFDYYQGDDPQHQVEGVGGYLPIERVYSYEPMPRNLSPEEQKYIVGVQANCWTEYMKNFRRVEYMELPRMAALSEIQWCAPEQKDYTAFMKRLPHLLDHYRLEDYQYAKVIHNVKLQLTTDTIRRAVMAQLSTFDQAEIHYTTDGSEPTLASPRYTEPLALTQACQLRAAAFRQGEKSNEVSKNIRFNRSTACPIRLLTAPHGSYAFAGAQLLTDGLVGEDTNFHSGSWMGFVGNNLEAVIDLGKAVSISSLKLNTCVEKGAWIFDARAIEIWGSTDGTNFQPLGKKDIPAMKESDRNAIYSHALTFTPQTVRYAKVIVKSEPSIPEWHGGKGRPGFVFVDEIEIN